MSLECSECERDLRGGHDPFCSRSKGWIKCGLPWTCYNDKGIKWPKVPNLDKRIKKVFGQTVAQAYKEVIIAEASSPKQHRDAKKKYKEFNQKVQSWVKEQPETKAYNEEVKKIDEKLRQKSFCGRELNRVGTIIEIRIGKDLKQYLIGDINKNGGVCDDCMDFDKEVVITRYKFLSSCLTEEVEGDW